ncbi:MAG: hypothetical protein K0R09_3045 [Clostridiales bacterium]|nr:hypothetical protein [Clostridiales bacterium]
MEFLQNLKKIIYYNIKITCNINFLAALILVALTPFIFSFRMLEFKDMAVVGEMYLSILGIVLFISLGDIENRDNIKEIIFSRKTPHIYIFILRMCIMMAITFLLISIITIYALYNKGNFSPWSIIFGTWISAVFLGLLGLTISNTTGNIASGYLIAFAYYLFEFITKGKYTKSFYLFSLLRNSFNEKYMILIIVAVMFGLNIAYVWKKS